jgi:hypothetical protein
MANLCAAIRLVEVKHVHHSTSACTWARKRRWIDNRQHNERENTSANAY